MVLAASGHLLTNPAVASLVRWLHACSVPAGSIQHRCVKYLTMGNYFLCAASDISFVLRGDGTLATAPSTSAASSERASPTVLENQFNQVGNN